MGHNISAVAWIIMITAIAGIGGTGLGGAFGAVFRRDSDRTVSLLLSFAGGIMLGVVCFDLLANAVHPDGSAAGVGVYFVIFGVLLGYGVIFALNNIIDRSANIGLKHIDAKHPRTADALDELIHYDFVRQQQELRSGVKWELSNTDPNLS
jgi:ZIP family zinc transporter